MEELPELRHLRSFAVVAEAGTVTAAAARLHIAQPSLSQQIAALERRVGAQLFHRGRRGMTLTDAGRRLLDAVNLAFGEIGAALADIRGTTLRAPTGLARGVPQTVLAAASAAVGDGVELVFEPVDSERQPELLRVGRLAFGVLRPPVETAGLTVRELAEAPLGVVVGRGHSLARHAELSWDDLREQRLLWFPASRAPGYAVSVLAHVAANGWRPETVAGDVASHTLFRHALLSDDRLVALRPQAALAQDSTLTWVPVGPNPPVERLVLAAATAGVWARRLERAPDR